jgi:hypothetical protein
VSRTRIAMILHRCLLLAAVAGLWTTACVKKVELPAAAAPAPAETVAAPAANADTSASSTTTAQAPEKPPVPVPNDTGPGEVKSLNVEELMQLNYAIYKFKEEFGRNPKSLQEMLGKTLVRVPKLPAGETLMYNPQTGKATIEKSKK